MSVKKYCYCENNCRYETLSKEEILAAIAQAVQTGKIGECDTGFVTTIKTINGKGLKFFIGEQSEYEALSEDTKRNLFALITNDTTKEGLLNAIAELKTSHNEIINGLLDGDFVAAEARHATRADSANQAIADGSGSIITSAYASLYGGSNILAGSNFNDYKEEGNYVIPSNDDAIAITNCPIGEAGQLKVLSGAGYKITPNMQWKYYIQIYISHQGRLFIRHYSSSPESEFWSFWDQFGGAGSQATNAAHAANADNATNATHATSADNATNADSAKVLANCNEATYDSAIGGYIIKEAGIYVLIGSMESGQYISDIIAIPSITSKAFGTQIGEMVYRSYYNYKNFTDSEFRLYFAPSLNVTHYKAIKIMSL